MRSLWWGMIFLCVGCVPLAYSPGGFCPGPHCGVPHQGEGDVAAYMDAGGSRFYRIHSGRIYVEQQVPQQAQ